MTTNAHQKSTSVLATSGIPVHAGKTRAGSTSPLHKCNKVTPNSDVAEQPNTQGQTSPMYTGNSITPSNPRS